MTTTRRAVLDVIETVISPQCLPRNVAARGKLTERSYYPNLIKVIKDAGGSGVSEVSFNSEPDIVFEMGGKQWLLSVKIGESTAILKSAFLQYNRHKDESGISQGMLLFLPERMRSVRPTEAALDNALSLNNVSCLVDAPKFKDEYVDVPFSGVMDRLKREAIPAIERKEQRTYSVGRIAAFLREQIEQLMGQIPPEDPSILKAIIDQNLLSGIGHLDKKHANVATQFLGASILLSQLMFLRMYGSAHPDIMPGKPVTRATLKAAFKKIYNINYKPIYDFDVIGLVSEEYAKETYDLISGLEIENTRFELPGRIFHALMPRNIRKLMAAFYTRPQSADILTNLSIKKHDDTVFDPACGSGTILVSAYRKKTELQEQEGIRKNLHQQFCEKDIFGGDIMPFAVHLTTANLAAMDPATTIKRTQIIGGDSLNLSPGKTYRGYQQRLFAHIAEGKDMSGRRYEIALGEVDAVLMNPPFTKVERGISQFVNMSRFQGKVGGEASLWVHFIMLANEFLRQDGICGAVLPVSILRGRETEKVRDFILTEMTPLYIVKATLNYGFSESSEYRDLLFVFRKAPAPEDHRVKFCLIKYDVNRTSWDQARFISETLKTSDHFRSKELDIESFSISDLRNHKNLMPFIGVTDYLHRDIFLSFVNKGNSILDPFPPDYTKEGLRSEGGVSKVVFFTRGSHPSRIEESFLSFAAESNDSITAKSKKEVPYTVDKLALSPSLRTGVGLDRMNIEGLWDYVAHGRYEAFPQVLRASGVKAPGGVGWAKYFSRLRSSIHDDRTFLVITLRLNPFSPNVHFISFFSETPLMPSDQFKILKEPNRKKAKAVCLLLNSALFLSNLFLFKEETTGRFIHIRSHDLDDIRIVPDEDRIDALEAVFDRYSRMPFPALREQIDTNFIKNYDAFQETKDWDRIELKVEPSPLRLSMDIDVFKALGTDITAKDLTRLYEAIEKEMIITRGLTRD